MDDGVLELAAACSDGEAALEVAELLAGTAYVDTRPGKADLPFRALITVATDDPRSVEKVGDVGTYLVFRRLKKPGVAGVIALYPLLRRQDLNHAEADAHWRDVHGPLALEHHCHMAHYSQLSVVANLSGLPLDGFALVGFASEEDLKNRFYTSEKSVAVIAEDTRKFADLRHSPHRLVTTERRFGSV